MPRIVPAAASRGSPGRTAPRKTSVALLNLPGEEKPNWGSPAYSRLAKDNLTGSGWPLLPWEHQIQCVIAVLQETPGGLALAVAAVGARITWAISSPSQKKQIESPPGPPVWKSHQDFRQGGRCGRRAAAPAVPRRASLPVAGGAIPGRQESSLVMPRPVTADQLSRWFHAERAKPCLGLSLPIKGRRTISTTQCCSAQLPELVQKGVTGHGFQRLLSCQEEQG